MIDTYTLVTARILQKMAEGDIPWRKPWRPSGANITKIDYEKFAFNRVTQKIYSTLNQYLLNKPGEYASFKQWEELGGHVKKGAKAEIVVFWKWIDKTEKTTDDDGNEITKLVHIPFLKYNRIFHISDVEGVEPLRFDKIKDSDDKKTFAEIATAENIINDYTTTEDIPLYYDGNRAFYAPKSDSITIPERFKFGKNGNEFYSTVFHEMAHSTGHKTRLDRFNDGNAYFGSEEYSKEELVAEISASAIMATLDIETEKTFTNSTAYLQSWIKALQNDKKMFVIASQQADKAVSYILATCNGYKKTLE